MPGRVIVNQAMAKFQRDNWYRNPYTIGANKFREWYEVRGKDVPMPEEGLPTQEDYSAWDRELEEYVVNELLRKIGYEVAQGWYPENEAFKKRELCEGNGQCSFDCAFWDKCKYRNS